MGAAVKRPLGIAIVLLELATTAIARAGDDPRDEARAHYDRGIELFNSGEYPLALVELQRAYDLAPAFRLLYYVGQAQIKAGQLARALVTLEQYLREGGAAISEERREEVTRDLSALRARTARLRITCNVDGASIAVQGKEVGVTPLAESLLVEAGPTRITATKSGYEPAARETDLAGGDAATIALELVKIPALDPPPPRPLTLPLPAPPPPAPPPARNLRPIIVGWSITGVLVAATAVAGAVAIARVDRVDDLRASPIDGTPDQARADLEHERRVARGWMIAADVAGAGALVAGGLSLYLTLGRHEPRSSAVVLSPRPFGADVRVRF